MVEHLRDARIGHALAYLRGDGSAHPQRQDIAERREIHALEAQRVADTLDRSPEEEAFRHVVELAGEGEEIAIAVDAGRRVLAERARHAGLVAGEVEDRAVLEEAAPLRVERSEVEVILHALTGFLEDAGEHPRHGQDRRAHVEAEATILPLRRLAAEPVVL